MEIKKKRNIYWDEDVKYSVRTNPDSSFAGIWFQTRGCTHDRTGGCTMCDYSIGPETDTPIMVKAVKSALQEIESSYHTLLISPAGSMLDPIEVPIDARNQIFELAAESPHKEITFETRADTINSENIEDVKNILGDRLKSIYLGIETSSDFINTYCINKGITIREIWGAAQILNRYGIKPIGNILAGVPMLSAKESYDIAMNSVNWCLENQIKPAIFATHIKENTLYHEIYKLGLCNEPSIWLLVEILLNLPEDLDIDICWYRTYGAFNLVKAADSCPECYENVLDALDDYNNKRDKSILSSLNCECYDKWKEKFKEENVPLPERIVKIYGALAENNMLDDFWIRNKERIEKNIYSEYVG